MGIQAYYAIRLNFLEAHTHIAIIPIWYRSGRLNDFFVTIWLLESMSLLAQMRAALYSNCIKNLFQFLFLANDFQTLQNKTNKRTKEIKIEKKAITVLQTWSLHNFR